MIDAIFEIRQRNCISTFLSLSAITFVAFSSIAVLNAQSKLETDQEVRVLYLGDWRDGVVMDKKGQSYRVEFYFGNSVKSEVFIRANIRSMNEVEAMDYSRTWKTADGSFSVDAALKAKEGENVILIKQDLSEVTVPLNRLSDADVKYVDKMLASNNRAKAQGVMSAAVTKLPEIEYFDTEHGGTVYFSGTSGTAEPFGATPGYLGSFKQMGVGFNLTRADQDLVAVVPIGGPDQIVLMTAREDNRSNKFFGDPEFQSQIYWVSLAKKKVIGATPVASEDYPIDYNPESKLLLTVNRHKFADDDDDPSHCTIWKLPVAGETAEPLVRWNAELPGLFDEFFGKIIQDRIAILKTDRNTYVAWDFVAKKELYTLKTESFFDVPLVMTPNRLNFIAAEDGQVRVIDSLTGDTRFAFRVPESHSSAANVNADGSKLAVLTASRIYVWDLASGSSDPVAHPAPLIGSPFASRIDFVDDNHLFGESMFKRVLYSLELDLPVWSYDLDSSDQWLNRNPLRSMVIGGKFFYVARSGGFDPAVAIGAVELPGPGVDEIVKNIDRESLYMIGPGTRVGITLGSVSDPAQVREYLIEKINSNGWVHDDSSEFQLYAEMGVGETQSVTYVEFGGGLRGAKGKESTASFRPHYSSLKLTKGDLVVWSQGTSTGPPPIISGNNIQRKVNQFQSPQLEFFRDVVVENRILDPKYSRGFGLSFIGRRGIEVLETAPPGRVDDPEAAEIKALQDRLKELEDRQKNKDSNGNEPGDDGSR